MHATREARIPSVVVIVGVQSLSRVQLFATPWTAASLSIAISQSLRKPMSIELLMPSNHLILCCPLFLPPSIFPSICVFPNESAFGIRWPKYWSFSFSINPSNEYSGLISFRIDWLNLLAVQGTLKSLLQHHNLKASILLCPACFMVLLSHPYMTPGNSFDCMDLCQQSDVFAFEYTVKLCHMPLVTAAAAASLQACPTLCDPIDGSPPGSPVPGSLQARTLERVATSFSNA